MSEVSTFDCFYLKWQAACADAVNIGEVSGNAPYDKGYMCQPDGVGSYAHQIGSDVANKMVINYQDLYFSSEQGIVATTCWHMESTLWLRWCFDSVSGDVICEAPLVGVIVASELPSRR